MNPARLPRWLDATLSAWLLFWASLIVVYNHAGALAYAGLVVLLGAAGWIVLARRTALRGRAVLFGLPFAFLFGWMVITTRWGALGAETAWRLGLQLVLMLSLPAYLMTRGEGAKTALSHILMATAVGGAALMLADALSGYGFSLAVDPVAPGSDLNYRQGEAEMHLGRGQVAWALFAPVLLGLFATRLRSRAAWACAIAFLGLLLAGTVFNRLFVPAVILLGGLGAFALALRMPEPALKLSVWGAALSVLLAPLIGWVSGFATETLMARLPMSWDHRLRMWDYTLDRIGERPLTGHGLDASRVMQDGFTTRIGVDIPFISLHPHNVGLQVWLELGGLGAVFAAGALLTLHAPLSRLAGRNRWRTAALAGLVTGLTVAAAVTLGAWQYWWWGLAVMAAALVALVPEPPLQLADEA